MLFLLNAADGIPIYLCPPPPRFPYLTTSKHTRHQDSDHETTRVELGALLLLHPPVPEACPRRGSSQHVPVSPVTRPVKKEIRTHTKPRYLSGKCLRRRGKPGFPWILWPHRQLGSGSRSSGSNFSPASKSLGLQPTLPPPSTPVGGPQCGEKARRGGEV